MWEKHSKRKKKTDWLNNFTTHVFSKFCDRGLKNYRKFFASINFENKNQLEKKIYLLLCLSEEHWYIIYFSRPSADATLSLLSIQSSNITQSNREKQLNACRMAKNSPESNPPVEDPSNSLKSFRTACNRSKDSNDPFSGCPSDWWLL